MKSGLTDFYRAASDRSEAAAACISRTQRNSGVWSMNPVNSLRNWSRQTQSRYRVDVTSFTSALTIEIQALCFDVKVEFSSSAKCHKPRSLLWNRSSRGAPACCHKVAVTSASCWVHPAQLACSSLELPFWRRRTAWYSVRVKPDPRRKKHLCVFQNNSPEVGSDFCLRVALNLCFGGEDYFQLCDYHLCISLQAPRLNRWEAFRDSLQTKPAHSDWICAPSPNSGGDTILTPYFSSLKHVADNCTIKVTL